MKRNIDNCLPSDEPKLKQTKLIGFLTTRPSKNPAAIADPHDHHPGPHLQHHETAVPDAIMRDDESSTCAARFLQSDVRSEVLVCSNH